MIKIKNIYEMLVYVTDSFNSKGTRKVDNEEFDNNIYDLLSMLLVNDTNYQIKRGLHKNYVQVEETRLSPKGKINISNTIKSNSLSQHKVSCEYDEYIEDIYLNQIVKLALVTLFKSPYTSKKFKIKLKKNLMYFNNVSNIDIHSVKWNKISFNRNNSSYKMLIRVCYIVLHDLIFTTENGKFEYREIIREEDYHKLFEKFVRNYYKKHYYLGSAAKEVKWDAESINDKSKTRLPQMITDITLQNKERILIIDTKFYSKDVFSRKYDSQEEKLISDNLYQIFAYVKNKASLTDKIVCGLVLYGKVGNVDDVLGDYNMKGNKISFRTIDLNQDFENICLYLDNIVKEFIGNENKHDF